MGMSRGAKSRIGSYLCRNCAGSPAPLVRRLSLLSHSDDLWRDGLHVQIFLCLLYRLAQIVIRGDVVPVEDRAGFVTADLHGDAFSDASTDHVTNTGSAQVVKQFACHARCLTSRRPGSTRVAYR